MLFIMYHITIMIHKMKMINLVFSSRITIIMIKYESKGHHIEEQIVKMFRSIWLVFNQV